MTDQSVNVNITATDNASSVVAKAGANIKQSIDVASDSAKRFADVVTIAAGVLLRDFVQAAFTASIRGAEAASKAFQNYELTLTKIVSATDAVGSEARQLSAELDGVNRAQTDLGYSGREAASALESLVKAGMDGSVAGFSRFPHHWLCHAGICPEGNKPHLRLYAAAASKSIGTGLDKLASEDREGEQRAGQDNHVPLGDAVGPK